ncbi:ester cyclase [Chloroflexia bacterium SDU3-3]|nr:ester cyclase [Chloroflexia bacterium SDU3-3]
MSTEIERNKAAVVRFNKEVIEGGSRASFEELMDPRFVNRSAAPGAPDGPESMWGFFTNVLRPAFPDLVVEIHDQIAEGDKVVTRKSIIGTHQGPFLGIAATGRRVTINITDIVRVVDGRYYEHWGSADLFGVQAQLTAP